jgi:hypothetical protein
MRIELPAASWADAAHRADEDAHTLTLVAQSPDAWSAPVSVPDPALTSRTGVGDAPAVPLTLTL